MAGNRLPPIHPGEILREERLSRYFGTTSRFWMNMQASWELEVAEDQLGKVVKCEVFPRTAG